MVYIYSNAERDEEEFLIFKVLKVGLHVNIHLSKLKTAKKKRYLKKKHYKPYMAKKTSYPATQGRRNKVL